MRQVSARFAGAQQLRDNLSTNHAVETHCQTIINDIVCNTLITLYRRDVAFVECIRDRTAHTEVRLTGLKREFTKHLSRSALRPGQFKPKQYIQRKSLKK